MTIERGLAGSGKSTRMCNHAPLPTHPVSRLSCSVSERHVIGAAAAAYGKGRKRGPMNGQRRLLVLLSLLSSFVMLGGRSHCVTWCWHRTLAVLERYVHTRSARTPFLSVSLARATRGSYPDYRFFYRHPFPITRLVALPICRCLGAYTSTSRRTSTAALRLNVALREARAVNMRGNDDSCGEVALGWSRHWSRAPSAHMRSCRCTHTHTHTHLLHYLTFPEEEEGAAQGCHRQL